MEDNHGTFLKENNHNDLDSYDKGENELKIIPLNPLQSECENKYSDVGEISHKDRKSIKQCEKSIGIFRLFVKNGEYVYARPYDIVLIESCDHMVRIHLAVSGKLKKTVRHNTLKDFLLQLPKEHFIRIGRFCAVNTSRISGGSFNDQTFEFDFGISIKLKHPISHATFSSIGK